MYDSRLVQCTKKSPVGHDPAGLFSGSCDYLVTIFVTNDPHDGRDYGHKKTRKPYFTRLPGVGLVGLEPMTPTMSILFEKLGTVDFPRFSPFQPFHG